MSARGDDRTPSSDDDDAAPHVHFGVREAATADLRLRRRLGPDAASRRDTDDGNERAAHLPSFSHSAEKRPDADVIFGTGAYGSKTPNQASTEEPRRYPPPPESLFMPSRNRSMPFHDSLTGPEDWNDSADTPRPRQTRSRSRSRSRSPRGRYLRGRVDRTMDSSGNREYNRDYEPQTWRRLEPEAPPNLPNRVSRGSNPYISRSYDRNWRGLQYVSRESARGRSGSISEDDLEPYDKAGFVLAPQPSLESSKDAESDTESPVSEERSTLNDEKVRLRSIHATAIRTSQYTGNAELGGSHTATLTALHGPTDRKQSLFRWLHVKQEVMNLEELWAEVSRLPGLTGLEKRALSRLRTDVKSSVKPKHNSRGEKVGYMEPRCVDVPLKSLDKKMEADATTGSARWICIPYFSLQKYSGLLSASNPSQFPAQTLLQVEYSRSNVQRDREQAVCQLGHTKRDVCFHVCQLWCIVIDNSLLVTCGSMTQSDLQGDALKVITEPSRNISIGNQCNILVLFGEYASWSLNLDECQSWFAFVSKFQAFWPQTLEFWHKNQIITADKWPRIIRLAEKSPSSMVIKMKIGNLPKSPMCGILQSESHDKDMKQASGGKGVRAFAHVMLFSQGDHKRPLTSTTGLATVKVQLEAAHNILISEAPVSSRNAYKHCELSTRKQCYDYVSSMTEQVGTLEDGARISEDGINIYNAADVLYRFFLPSDLEDSTVGKFWGAVKRLIAIETTDEVDEDIYDRATSIRTYLKQLTPKLIAFQDILSHASKDESSTLEMPQDFATAWLNAVMCMVYCSQGNRGWRKRATYLTYFVEAGMSKFMRWLPDKSLLERASMLPTEISSILILGLLRDQVGKSDDISESYSQYLGSLEHTIMSKSSDRSYQHRIDLARHEMALIRRTLRKQRNIIAGIKKSLITTEIRNVVVETKEEPAYGRRERDRASIREQPPAQISVQTRASRRDEPYTRMVYNDMEWDDGLAQEFKLDSKLSPMDKGGLRQLFLEECSQLIEQRFYEFVRNEDYANYLEQTNTFRMNSTKDRQENAIFAFTIVTIIFLPLSAVSSIFGMNTVDVRDMEASQWLYWSVALPVTAVVILTGLWWMGELANIAKWLMRRPRQSYDGGSVMVPSQSMEEAMEDDEYYVPAAQARTVPAAANPFAPRITAMETGNAASPFAPQRQGLRVAYRPEIGATQTSGVYPYSPQRPFRRTALVPENSSRSYLR